MLFNTNYQIQHFQPLKIKLRLNVNSNKVLPKVNLALTPLGLNASQLISQFCLLTPFLYDEQTFVNVIAEELDDNNFLETYITKLEWKGLLFAQPDSDFSQGITDSEPKFMNIALKMRLLLFLVWLKIFDQINSNLTNMIYSTTKESAKNYIFGQYAKYWEQLQLITPPGHFAEILDSTKISFVYPRLSSASFLNHFLFNQQIFGFYSSKFQLYLSQPYFYKLINQYKYIILNHLD